MIYVDLLFFSEILLLKPVTMSIDCGSKECHMEYHFVPKVIFLI